MVGAANAAKVEAAAAGMGEDYVDGTEKARLEQRNRGGGPKMAMMAPSWRLAQRVLSIPKRLAKFPRMHQITDKMQASHVCNHWWQYKKRSLS